MKPEILHCEYWEVETSCGTIILPCNVCSRSEVADYVDGTIQSVKRRKGWLARLSMPGYLDATEWTAFRSRRQALQFILDFYGTQDDSPQEDWEHAIEKELSR